MSHGDLEDVALLDRLAATLGLPSHCGSPPEVSLLGEEVNTQHCTRSVSLASLQPPPGLQGDPGSDFRLPP